MDATIKNLLHQLPSLNADLENPEKIADMTWFSFSESNDALKVVYIFRSKSSELLIAKNGKVLDYSWEFVPNSNSLLIQQHGEKLLYNAIFLKNHYLVLRLDGTDQVLLLINQAYLHRILEVAPKNIGRVIINDLKKLLPEPEIPTISMPEFEEIETPTVPEPVEEQKDEVFEEEGAVEEEEVIYETEEELEAESTPTENIVDEVVVAEEEPELVDDSADDADSDIEEEDEEIETNQEEIRPLSILEKLQQEKGLTDNEEEEEEDEEQIFPFGEKKSSLNDILKEKLQKEKKETLLDKLAGKNKKGEFE